ncbi:unnamed protein product [Polarella glacialis]|uniref:Guanylate cyclase domain-containing protein n=1 Tax=Polarella glacialis TaxID=89957 RepID=A0A813F0E7_POLGL|nr:unnamed protein product [Polarella glacialis]
MREPADLQLQNRLKLFQATVTPTVLYGRVLPDETVAESDCATSAGEESDTGEQFPEEAQVQIENWVDWIRRLTHTAEDNMLKAGLDDWVRLQKQRKWQWAGHVARRTDDRWSTTLVNWVPSDRRRRVGDPVRRWAGCIVCKIETVGDAYIAGQAEVPLTRENSPRISVALFALGMVEALVEATHNWSRMKGESVSCRVGIHSGRCVGGIVGTDMQRYHLFGDLLTTLELLESTAPRGRVQISNAYKKSLELELRAGQTVIMDSSGMSVSVESRAEPSLMTSKGDVIAYHEVGGATFLLRTG